MKLQHLFNIGTVFLLHIISCNSESEDNKTETTTEH